MEWYDHNILLLTSNAPGMCSEIQAGIASYIKDREYSSIHIVQSLRKLRTLLTRYPKNGLIGLINDDALIDFLKANQIAYVNISSSREDALRPAVLPDNYQIGLTAADYLISRGHTDFLYFGTDTFFSQSRHHGFRDRLNQHNFNCQYLDYVPQNVLEKLRQCIQRCKRRLAIFAASDYYAARVIIEMRKFNLSPPKDFAILGVDNDETRSKTCMMDISSIDPNFHRIGFLAAQKLDHLMNGKTVDDLEIVPSLGVIPKVSSEAITNDPVVNQAINYIKLNTSHTTSVEDVSRHIDYSRRTLEKKFTEHLGLTISKYMKITLMDKATILLKETDFSIKEISFALGYKDYRYFSQDYKKHFGYSPTTFRSSLQ